MEQKCPSQATFKTQINTQKPAKQSSLLINPTVLITENEKIGFPPYHVGWCLNLPSESGAARVHLSPRTFLGLESNNQTWVMPSNYKSVLDWGKINVLQETASQTNYWKTTLLTAAGVFGYGTLHQGQEKTGKGWNSRYSATESQSWHGCIRLLQGADGWIVLSAWPGLKESPGPHEEWDWKGPVRRYTKDLM